MPGIAGLGAAAALCYGRGMEERIDKLYALREYFIKKIMQIDDVIVNGTDQSSHAPHIVSATFKGIKSEVLLHSLEEDGIFISSGSACSSNRPGLSFALGAMGLDKEAIGSTVRFSFSINTTRDELERCVDVLEERVPFLRQFVRR